MEDKIIKRKREKGGGPEGLDSEPTK